MSTDTVNTLDVEGVRVSLSPERMEKLGDSIALMEGETHVYEFVGPLRDYVAAMWRAGNKDD